jgi:cyclophilin family peptidyl-prolyl cis-trans isomerase
MRTRRVPLLLLALLAANATRVAGSTPAMTSQPPAQSLNAGGSAVAIDLRNHFNLPGVTGPLVQFDTTLGRLNVELRPDAAPKHVANFLSYVAARTYSNTMFHRSAALDGSAVSIVQGGGYLLGASGTSTVAKQTPVALEYNLPNARGTLAAARTSDINSATSEWYFNVRDNSTTLGPTNGGGYTVFGRVIGNGMAVIDAIGALPRVNAGSPFNELPVRNFTSGQVGAANLILVNSVSAASIYPGDGPLAILSFTATSSHPEVISVAVNNSTLVLSPVGGGVATVNVTAIDTNGASVAAAVSVTVAGTNSARAPAISSQPPALLRLAAGTTPTVALSVAATGTPTPAYQWRRNGVAIPGETSPSLVLTRATEAQAGAYTCVVSNSNGSVTSDSSTVSFIAATAAETGRLINLSIRSTLAPGEQMTMGTVLGGAGTRGTKALLARVAGPSLAQFGLNEFVPDPRMSLVRTGSGTVSVNDDWGDGTVPATAFSEVGAFPFTSVRSRDAAIYQPALLAGDYTVELGDKGGSSGDVIAELYDSTPGTAFTGTTPRLINVSVRQSISETSKLVAGFVIGGTTARTVLIRAIGPGLAVFGVPETMPDPGLKLLSTNSTLIGANDNWGGTAQLTAASAAVGAFAVTNPSSNDAMLLITLPAGEYTTEVTGKGAGGAALVEVYEVP